MAQRGAMGSSSRLVASASAPAVLTDRERDELRRDARRIRDLERTLEGRRARPRTIQLREATGTRGPRAMSHGAPAIPPLPRGGAPPPCSGGAPPGGARGPAVTRLVLYPGFLSLAEGDAAVVVERLGRGWRCRAAAEAARARLRQRVEALAASGPGGGHARLLASCAVSAAPSPPPPPGGAGRRCGAVERTDAGLVVAAPAARRRPPDAGYRVHAAARARGALFVECLNCGDASPDPRAPPDALVGWLAALGMPAAAVDTRRLDDHERAARLRAAADRRTRVSAAVAALGGAAPGGIPFADLAGALRGGGGDAARAATPRGPDTSDGRESLAGADALAAFAALARDLAYDGEVGEIFGVKAAEADAGLARVPHSKLKRGLHRLLRLEPPPPPSPPAAADAAAPPPSPEVLRAGAGARPRSEASCPDRPPPRGTTAPPPNEGRAPPRPA